MKSFNVLNTLSIVNSEENVSSSMTYLSEVYTSLHFICKTYLIYP